MSTLIKRFHDGSYIEYDRGGFDEWCVYYTAPNKVRIPPRDSEYFAKLKALSCKYSAYRMYEDFVKIFDWTGKVVSQDTLDDITKLATHYGEDALTIDIIFSILYVAMIAEENKANTKLGKRIKRLGVHLLLLESESVGYAANVMRGKRWFEIDAECKKRGF